MNTKYQYVYQCKYKEDWKSKEKRRIKTESKYNDGKFIYSWKSETNSWIIGDTSRSGYDANAIFAGSSSNCPDEIIFKGIFNPRESGNNIVSSKVKEGQVEEVGVRAFTNCGLYSNTKKVVVPKEVKIIREYGFCYKQISLNQERGLSILSSLHDFERCRLIKNFPDFLSLSIYSSSSSTCHNTHEMSEGEAKKDSITSPVIATSLRKISSKLELE